VVFSCPLVSRADILATERIANEAKANKELLDQIAIENGQGVECGCCFGEYVPVSTIHSGASVNLRADVRTTCTNVEMDISFARNARLDMQKPS
jgi:hypothetical protein